MPLTILLVSRRVSCESNVMNLGSPSYVMLAKGQPCSPLWYHILCLFIANTLVKLVFRVLVCLSASIKHSEEKSLIL